MADRFGFGVRSLFIAKVANDDGSAPISYGDQIEVGSLNKVNFSRQSANAKAFGDDKKVADITVTTGGTLEITFWGLSQKSNADLYGHTFSEETGLVEKMSDVAPYVGVGYVRTFEDSAGNLTYDAYVIHKAQAVQGDEEANTASEDIDLSSETVTFNAVEPQKGEFRSVKSFTTEQEATSFIKNKLSLSA